MLQASACGGAVVRRRGLRPLRPGGRRRAERLGQPERLPYERAALLAPGGARQLAPARIDVASRRRLLRRSLQSERHRYPEPELCVVVPDLGAPLEPGRRRDGVRPGHELRPRRPEYAGHEHGDEPVALAPLGPARVAALHARGARHHHPSVLGRLGRAPGIAASRRVVPGEPVPARHGGRSRRGRPLRVLRFRHLLAARGHDAVAGGGVRRARGLRPVPRGRRRPHRGGRPSVRRHQHPAHHARQQRASVRARSRAVGDPRLRRGLQGDPRAAHGSDGVADPGRRLVAAAGRDVHAQGRRPRPPRVPALRGHESAVPAPVPAQLAGGVPERPRRRRLRMRARRHRAQPPGRPRVAGGVREPSALQALSRS